MSSPKAAVLLYARTKNNNQDSQQDYTKIFYYFFLHFIPAHPCKLFINYLRVTLIATS